MPEVKIAALNIGNGRNPVNQGSIDIRLVPSNERDRTMQQIMDDLRAEVRNVQGLSVTVVSNQGRGRGDSRPVQIGLRGSDIKQLKEYALELADLVRKVPGATDVDISDSDEQPEILIRLDQRAPAFWGSILIPSVKLWRWLLWAKAPATALQSVITTTILFCSCRKASVPILTTLKSARIFAGRAVHPPGRCCDISLAAAQRVLNARTSSARLLFMPTR